MSKNPYPANSPSWKEWEKQVGRVGEPSVQELAVEAQWFKDTQEAPVVTEDDWELGPVCSVEHEECESCQ